MSEREFWLFLNRLYAEKGRAAQQTMVIDTGVPLLDEAGRFISGHAVLPNDYEKIGLEQIGAIAQLLLKGEANILTKEAILMILAHHPSRDALRALTEYSRRPDKELRIFAEFALDECRWWNSK